MARGPPLKKQPGLEIVLKSDWRECVERREVRVQMRERKRGEEGGREEERTLKNSGGWQVQTHVTNAPTQAQAAVGISAVRHPQTPSVLSSGVLRSSLTCPCSSSVLS